MVEDMSYQDIINIFNNVPKKANVIKENRAAHAIPTIIQINCAAVNIPPTIFSFSEKSGGTLYVAII